MAQSAVLTIPLTANTTPSVGSATPTFARNFEAAYLSALPDTWADAAHNTAAFGVYGYNSGSTQTSAFSSPENRDLTDADWTKTNCTALKNVTGLKGDANAASRLTADANNGTCLRAFTLASATRTFSASVKRLTGTGTVEITTNGGTNWTDITSQINDSTWSRVTLSATGVTNPSVGFRLGTSGDAIAVDGMSLATIATGGYPLIARAASRESDSLSWTSFTVPTAGKRYYIQAKLRFDTKIGHSLNVDFGNSAYSTDLLNFNLNTSSSDVVLFGSLTGGSTLRANINQTTSTAAGRALTALSNLTEVTAGIEFGMRQVVLTLNGVRYSADFGNGNASWWNDPTFTNLTHIRVRSIGYITDLEYGERTDVEHFLLLGDSITSDSKYLLTFETQETSLNRIWNNRGISGNDAADVAARITTDVTPFYFSDALTNTVILWVGTNGLAANNSAATELADVQTCIDNITGGATWEKIYLVNCLPRTAGFSAGATAGSFETQRLSFNSGLSGLTDHNGVIDVAGIAELADSTDTDYYTDGIHINQAGYDLAVAEILSYINNPPSVGRSGSAIASGVQLLPAIF